MAAVLVIAVSVGCALAIIKLVDWKLGYSAFIKKHYRTPVGAALIPRDGKILLRNLPLGPFKDFWFLPSAYLHKEQHDKTTLDTARRKIKDLNEDIVIETTKKLTGKNGRLSGLDTITYALQLGLVPTIIDIYELEITNPNDIPLDNRTQWCGQEDLAELRRLHPLVPDIFNLYFDAHRSISSEQVEQESKQIFQNEPKRAKQNKPVDELPPEDRIIEAKSVQ